MKARRNEHGGPRSQKGRKLKLLLVGRNYELKDTATRRIFSGDRLWITGRSASLLGALERLQSEAMDLVLLSDEFRETEVALFISHARRVGFTGLVLCVLSMRGLGSDSSGGASPVGFSTEGFLGTPPHPMRITPGMRRQNERWSSAISFTARQRAVLMGVAKGWTNQQVAGRLKCTEGGVKATLQELFNKLGVRKRARIVRMAFEKGLVDAEGNMAARSYEAGELARSLALPADMQGKDTIHVGDFVIDLARHRAWVRGAETHLTPNEFQLLTVFATHPGELVRSSSLRELFWRNPAAMQDALRVLVSALRAKIEVSKTPRYVVTARNLGYRFIPSPSLSGSGEDGPRL